MILVDSSVWIAYFRGDITTQTERLDTLLGRQPLAIGDLILTEVLQGYWLDNDYATAKRLLSSLTVFDLAGREIVLKAADHIHQLNRMGISILNPLKAIVASFCIAKDIPLLHSDRVFEPFAAHLNLESVISAGY